MSRLPLLERTDGESRARVPFMRGRTVPRNRAVLALAGVTLLFALPEITALTGLQFERLFRGILFGLAAVGLNLLLRHTKLVSFGHVAFFGGGAYASAVLAAHYQVSEGLFLLLGATVIGTTLAVIIGYFVAGYVDIYFALLTLAFNQVLFATVYRSEYFNFSDGLRVRVGGDTPTLFGISWTSTGYDLVLYYMTVVILLVMLLAAWKLVNSPFGRALDAIGQDRTRARFVGIPVERYVWVAFAISGLYGAVAGGLYAMLQLHVLPEPTLYVFVSGEILFMAILGGFGTLAGPLVGGVVLVYLLEATRFMFPYEYAPIGFVLLAIVFFMPNGILGSGPTIVAECGRRLRNPRLVRDDAEALGTTVVRGVNRAVTSVRIIVFGVN